MASTRAQVLFLLSILFVGIARSQQCWYPDGQTQSSDVPCNQTIVDAGGNTPCCNQHTYCLANGLCLGDNIMRRGSCTDPNWGSACPQACRDENPSGSMPFTPCDVSSSTWACNVNSTACTASNPPFFVPQSNGIILRRPQVEAIGIEVDILVQPTTIIVPPSQSTAIAVVTVTSTSTANAGGFTAGQVAGAAAGVGGGFLIAMFCALSIIFRQRRELKEARNDIKERDRLEREALIRNQAPSMHTGTALTFGSSPVSAWPGMSPQQGVFREAENNPVNELQNEGPLSELDSNSNGAWKPLEDRTHFA